MRLTLRDIYAQGRCDGHAAAETGGYREDAAAQHARAYMRFAREEWGLTPRRGVRVQRTDPYRPRRLHRWGTGGGAARKDGL